MVLSRDISDNIRPGGARAQCSSHNILNSVVKLLESLPTNLHWDIYLILSNLVSHKSTMTAVLDMFPYNLPGSHWCKSVDGTALVDPLASSWEGLVIAKWLDGRCKAAAKATCNSLVALVCNSDIPQVVNRALWVLSRVPQIKFPRATTGVPIEAKLLDHIADMLNAQRQKNAIVVANILNSAEKLLRYLPPDLHWDIYLMMESLASHMSTATAVRTLLVTLWHEYCDCRPPAVTAHVAGLRNRIARWQMCNNCENDSSCRERFEPPEAAAKSTWSWRGQRLSDPEPLSFRSQGKEMFSCFA
ncbi:hypothetical protein C8J57DRAFT_1237128 [Mycena rebaudengoi]|nr:hypothetical protein C8J57DRAFT_1237128 [Mycena rebaudengoi]